MSDNTTIENDEPGTLKDLLKGIAGKQRKYLVLRISGVTKDDALIMLSSDKWGLISWSRNKLFQKVNRKIKVWQTEFKAEAIKMLRRSNQLLATLFEKNVIETIIHEVETGEYRLIKTMLAKEVYSKLINDLDSIPAIQRNSWEQTIGKLSIGGANDDYRKTRLIEETKHQESLNEVASFQGDIQSVEKDSTSGVFTVQENANEEHEKKIDE